MRHELKCEAEYYADILSGSKNFEFRKNDRGFEVGDELVLVEISEGVPTGRRLSRLFITYILHGGRFGLPKSFCIMEFYEDC